MFVMKCVVGRREGKEEQADTLQVQTLNYNIFKRNILQQYIEIYSNNIIRRRYLGLSLCHSQTQWPVSLLKNTCKQCCNLFKFFKKAKCNAYKVLDRDSPDEFRFSLPLGPLHKIHQNPASDASPTGQNHSRHKDCDFVATRSTSKRVTVLLFQSSLVVKYEFLDGICSNNSSIVTTA